MGGGNQGGMPSMNQFMPGYFPPMDPSAMYGMGMGMPNQGGKIYFLIFFKNLDFHRIWI